MFLVQIMQSVECRLSIFLAKRVIQRDREGRERSLCVPSLYVYIAFINLMHFRRKPYFIAPPAVFYLGPHACKAFNAVSNSNPIRTLIQAQDPVSLISNVVH